MAVLEGGRGDSERRPGRVEPRLQNRLVGPQELETGVERVLLVEVFPVADMVVHIRLECGLDIGQHHFPDGKVYRDVVPVPDRPLGADRTVGTAADHKALLLDSSDHGHGHDSGRVADLQSAVYVKAYEYDQAQSSVRYRW